MYTIREFAKKRINSGVFARFVLFLSGITELMKKTNDTEIRYSSKRFFAFFMQFAATKQFLFHEKTR